MPYQVSGKRSSRKSRKVINIHQKSFAKGYVSTIDNSRRPVDSLSDMTNIEVTQDNVVRPRPPLVRYGTQPTLTVIGRGKYRYNSERYLLWAMDDSGTGKVYTQKDGGAFTVCTGSNTFDDVAWLSSVQSKGKSYIFNGVDNLKYLTHSSGAITAYIALTTPGAPTQTRSGAGTGSAKHYYKVTANNEVGESIASAVGTNHTDSTKPRNSWVSGTDYFTITWSAVANATSYTIYYGSTAARCEELYTVESTVTTYVDYGNIQTNPFKLAPEGNSTEGQVFKWMYSDTKNSQLFGITSDNKLYYSAPGTGDFSPYQGGGWVAIDEDGDTELNFVDGFRNGKGDSVITVSARGAAGTGKLYHVSFETLSIGDDAIVYPNVYEANGQAGTYAPRATVKARDSLIYPTGKDFTSTGTSQNVMNILTNNSITNLIEPDVSRISLGSLHKAVGVALRDVVYYALPVGSDENNEIWCLDLTRKNLWVLRWQVSAKDLWLYEDNDGYTHLCALVDNKVLEFTRAGAQPHQDDGVAWTSRVAFQSLVWDEDGIIMGKIRNQYFKLLFPKGTITVNATGLTRNGASTAAGSDTYTVTTTPTGWGQWMFTGHTFGEDPGEINTYGKSVSVLNIKPKGLLAQLDWEVVADTAGTDYILSAVNTRGVALDELIIKT